MLQGRVGILCRQARQHGDLLGHSLACQREIRHLAGRILDIFQIFDELAVFFVLAEGEDLPVNPLAPHPLDLVQQKLADGVGGVALAGEEDAAAPLHPQHLAAEARVGQALVVEAAVERRHPAADAAEDKLVQHLAAQVAEGQRLFLEAQTEAGFGDGHGDGLFRRRQRHGFGAEQPLHLFRRALVHQAVAGTGREDLLHAGVARCGQHHIARGIESPAAIVEHPGGYLGNALHRARNVAADGMAVVQALTQAGDEPPVRAVIVHFDLLPDDALLLGDGLLGEVGASHHAQQHVEALVQLFCGRKEIAGAVEGGEGIGVGAGLGKLCKGVAILVLKHLVLEEMGYTGGQMHLPLPQPEVPVDGAEAGCIDDMGAGVARHGADEDSQPRGQGLPLVCGGAFQHAPGVLSHSRLPPLSSADSSPTG